jgi:hypothetical protein
MATGISNFSITSSGNNINYSITWEGFGCVTTRELIFKLFDVNRNAVVASSTVTTGLNTTGTYSSSFSSVYAGLFNIIGIFVCGGQYVSEYTTLDHVHGSTIAPPTGGSEPTPVTSNPNSNPGICIPTTGAVSMGDINIILERTRNLSNTLLSGTSNPSVSPAQFGLSYLPSTGTISKSRPNAISEFRGYCHVPPIVPTQVLWNFTSNTYGSGTLQIEYTNTSNSVITFTSSITPSQFLSGNFLAKPGTGVAITVSNQSSNITATPLTVSQTGDPTYSSAGTSSASNSYSLIAKTNALLGVDAGVDGANPFG